MRVAYTPQRTPICVFCKYWMGDADIKMTRYGGVEFEREAKGPCMKRKGNETSAWFKCNQYSPNHLAEK